MPYKDVEQYEIITLWVPKGTKYVLRRKSAELGYKGLSDYIKAVIGIEGLKRKGEAVAGQIGGNNV